MMSKTVKKLIASVIAVIAAFCLTVGAAFAWIVVRDYTEDIRFKIAVINVTANYYDNQDLRTKFTALSDGERASGQFTLIGGQNLYLMIDSNSANYVDLSVVFDEETLAFARENNCKLSIVDLGNNPINVDFTEENEIFIRQLPSGMAFINFILEGNNTSEPLTVTLVFDLVE